MMIDDRWSTIDGICSNCYIIVLALLLLLLFSLSIRLDDIRFFVDFQRLTFNIEGYFELFFLRSIYYFLQWIKFIFLFLNNKKRNFIFSLAKSVNGEQKKTKIRLKRWRDQSKKLVDLAMEEFSHWSTRIIEQPTIFDWFS